MNAMTWLKRIAAGLLLGVMTTVVVAWILASSVNLLTDPSATKPTRSWMVRSDEPGVFIHAAEYRRGPGAVMRRAWKFPPSDAKVDWTIPESLARDVPSWAPRQLPSDQPMTEFVAGWPLPAMTAAPVRTLGVLPTPRIEFAIGPGKSDEFHLPILPRARGMAAGALLFGSAWVGLMCAAAALVSRARRAMNERGLARWHAVSLWLRRAATGLALALLVVIGSGWWFANSGRSQAVTPTVVTYRDPDKKRDYYATRVSGLGWRGVEVSVHGVTDFPLSSTPRPPAWMTKMDAYDQYSEVCFGWPIAALRHGGWNPQKGPGLAQGVIVHTGSNRYWLPVAPAWEGFIASLALWGGGYLVAMLLRDRYRRRRRNGRCARCLYDLRGLPAGSACPECGTPVALGAARSVPAA